VKSSFACLLCLLLVLCACCLPASAQEVSNKGTDFWLAYPAHTRALESEMNVYVTATINTKGTVSIPGQNYTADFTVTANKVTILDIPHVAYISTAGVVENQGIHITTEEPVVVFSHIYASDVSGSTIVLPTPALGREYFAISHENSKEFPMNEFVSFAQFVVVATEDHTTVEITPTVITTDAKSANTPFIIELMKGQVYQLQAEHDLTGSKIVSVTKRGEDCKRIAVFSGSTYTRLGCSEAESGDNLYQQLYPVNTWGKTFATVPSKTRWYGDKIRILAAEDGTKVTINGGAPVSLAKGGFYDFRTTKSNFIQATKPVLVVQYAFSQDCDDIPGDPEMIIISPIEQTLTDITVYSSQNYFISRHFINVVMETKETGSFRLDGNPVAFTPIQANPAYAYAQVEVQKGNHRLIADAGFSAIAYGFGRYESYGYAAGASAKSMIQHMTLDRYQYCDGEKVTYSGFTAYEPLSWHWDFGDGTTSTLPRPSHTYQAPGTYMVTLTTVRDNGNECGSTDVSVAEITISPNPEATFTFAPECLNRAMLFRDNSSVAGENNQVVEWLWDFGDGTTSSEQHPRHTYTAAKEYQVMLQVKTNSGCSSVVTKKVLVESAPVADFDVTGACQGEEIAFKDKSTYTTEPVTGWHWDFGDGTTKTQQHPEHTFSTSATYPVTLTLTFASGCQTSITRQVVINPKPEVKIELPDVCILDEAQFVNKSTISEGTLTYLWEFGDGHTSTEVNPKHRYTAEKVYTVRLTASSDKGCSETIEVQYMVSGAYPKADFTADQFCQQQGVQFTDASTVPFGRIVRWEWDFGDGTTGFEQHPKHVYAKAATYQVTLKAYSGIICESIVTKTITVSPNPIAQFQTGNVCDKEAVVFQSTSGVERGNIVSYHWDFGDGEGTSTLENPQYTYANPGTYPVMLTVTTDEGCQDADTKLVTVYARPTAAFSPVQACISDEVSFRDESSMSVGKIVSWYWSFGDGSTSIEQHPRHSYGQAKSYKVKLEVTTIDGCKDVIEKTVVIQVLPIASAGPDQLPVCGIISTTLAANIPALGTGTWTILNGIDGQFSDIHNPRATFIGKMGETYKLRWTVRNSPCIEAWDEVELRFGPVPKVNAGPDLEIIEGESITLQGSGEGTLLWSSANTLDNATQARPLAFPIVTTTYTLTATSAEGCHSDDQVTVHVLKKLKIPNGISPNGDGINDVWLIEGIEDYPNARIELFNRWGAKVYELQEAGSPWDGTRNGAPLPDGAYYYVIDTKKGRKAFTGAVTILR